MKKIALISNILITLCFLWLAIHLKDPHLLPYRSYETPVIVIIALAGMILALCLRWHDKPARIALSIMWTSVLLLAIHHEYEFHAQKNEVKNASGEFAQQLRAVGRHLIIGYDKVENVQYLARQGFIAGVYLSRRNLIHNSAQQLHAEIMGLQLLRQNAGLPPLLVATDQEGGSVSRLSPPLPLLPALSTIADLGLSPLQLQQRAMAYGAEQARALVSVGVNVNFSPVVDLKPTQKRGVLDFHTRIEERAIAQDPKIVSQVAIGYARGMYSQGVIPTLKHFPGLGSVAEDTHHFSARLSLPLNELVSRDWYPFQAVISDTPAFLMVGHVVVESVDSHSPASLSKKVIGGILRERWQYEGLVISDDMTMAAVYDLGLCQSAVKSLNADVDLLLLAYDWEKVYPVLLCLQKNYVNRSLKNLVSSDLRLGKTPWLISRH